MLAEQFPLAFPKAAAALSPFPAHFTLLSHLLLPVTRTSPEVLVLPGFSCFPSGHLLPTGWKSFAYSPSG